MVWYSGARYKHKKGLELFILASRRRFRSLAGRLFNLIFITAFHVPRRTAPPLHLNFTEMSKVDQYNQTGWKKHEFAQILFRFLSCTTTRCAGCGNCVCSLVC